MAVKIISGTEIRKEILKEIKEETDSIKAEYGKVPGLITILVGENPASVSYVSLKIKTAESLGFKEVQLNLPETVSEKSFLIQLKIIIKMIQLTEYLFSFLFRSI